MAATPNRKFRKNPLTWLHGRCWLDEEVPVAGPEPIPAPPKPAPIEQPALNEEFLARQRAKQQANLLARMPRPTLSETDLQPEHAALAA